MRTIRRSAALVLALALWWLASPTAALARAPACQNWSRVSDTIGLYFANRGVFFLHDSDHSEFIQEIAFGGASGPVTVVIPVDRMGMRQPYFQVTDMLAGTSAVRTRAEVLRGLTVPLPQGGAVVLKLEARGTRDGDGGRHDRCS
jgi:hypothetical protein